MAAQLSNCVQPTEPHRPWGRGQLFWESRVYHHNCRTHTTHSEGEGPADKPIKIRDSFQIEKAARGHEVWPLRRVQGGD